MSQKNTVKLVFDTNKNKNKIKTSKNNNLDGWQTTSSISHVYTVNVHIILLV